MLGVGAHLYMILAQAAPPLHAAEPMEDRRAESPRSCFALPVSFYRRELLCGTWPRDHALAFLCGFAGQLATRGP